MYETTTIMTLNRERRTIRNTSEGGDHGNGEVHSNQEIVQPSSLEDVQQTTSHTHHTECE